MRDSSANSIRDPSIWNSYRRAAQRCRHRVSGNSNSSESSSVAPLHHLENNFNLAVAKLDDNKLIESDSGRDKLRMEIKRLKRLIRRKDLIIDLLMEKIMRLQRLDISERDEKICNGHPHSTNNPSSSNAVPYDMSCDGTPTFQRKCSLSSVVSVTTEDSHFDQTAGIHSEDAIKSEMVVVRRCSKRSNSRRDEGCSRQLEALYVDSGSSCQNDTFVLHGSSEMTEMKAQSNAKDKRSAATSKKHEPNPDSRSNCRKFDRNIFVIESLSSSSEGSHPDWKAPLPPSVCLRTNRPELIRRIENRQAAISMAASLRRRIAEEKLRAARDVVQGKCTVNNVRKSLMLDPTRITAFPKSEMIDLTKRHLRASKTYKTQASDGRNRIDFAASKIIAHTFSETTRRAILEARSCGC